MVNPAALPAPRKELFAELKTRLHAAPGAPKTGLDGLVPTAVTALDDLLGGGLPKGALVTLEGAASSGRWSIIASLLAQVTRRSLGAIIDDGSLYPPTLEAAGVRLDRVLIVPAKTPVAIARAADALMRSRVARVIVMASVALRAPIWSRLANVASRMGVVLIVSLADNDADRRALGELVGSAQESVRSYIQRPFDVPAISRFSDGSYGVLYVADSLNTAVRETAYHLQRFFADGNAPEQDTRKKHIALSLKGKVRDIRRSVDAAIPPAIYDPNDYREAQAFGREQHSLVGGLHYDSVRNRDGGHCVGAFTPQLVAKANIAGDVSLVWDGSRFVEQHVITNLSP